MKTQARMRLQARQPRSKQQGVALITALIITAVAVSLATLVISRQQIQIRLTGNISALEQTYEYAYGMEDFAGTILKASFEDHPEYDSLNDSWYSENGLVLPITGGVMVGKLYDLQARINVNSLIRPIINVRQQQAQNTSASTTAAATNPDPANAVAVDTIDIASVAKSRLTDLIRIIDEEQEMGPPENFTAILRDWIDSDQENGKSDNSLDENDIGNGAETPYYQSLEPAYYSANTEMISPTEIRLIKNMKEEFYKRITDDISTLPITFNNAPTTTPININTASENVLLAIGLDQGAVENIIETRKEFPFETIDDFRNSQLIANNLIPNGVLDPLDLDVKSQYFLLEGKVEINNTRLFINSILWRNQSGVVSVIMRDFSNPTTISKAVN